MFQNCDYYHSAQCDHCKETIHCSRAKIPRVAREELREKGWKNVWAQIIDENEFSIKWAGICDLCAAQIVTPTLEASKT